MENTTYETLLMFVRYAVEERYDTVNIQFFCFVSES